MQLPSMRFSLFSWPFLIFSFSVLFSIDIGWATGKCLDDQSSLLLQLKESLIFDSSFSTKLVHWNQSSDCGDWPGVTCESGRGRVIGLDLSNDYISEGIDNSSSLFSLHHLQILNLAKNSSYFPEIPPNIGDLTNLTYLNFSDAHVGGQIPIEISCLTRLVTVDLSNYDSEFRGSRRLKLENPNLTRIVQNLTKLATLNLDGMDISAQMYEWSRAISSSLTNLQVLSLSNCHLSGPIDSSLSKLQSLSVIHLHQNNLATIIPDFFANFPNLTSLGLSSCGLYGTFPPLIFQVPALQTIDLSYNALLHGSLAEFPENGSLENLVLSGTSFSGTLPDSIGKLEMLTRIELARCNFNGTIPSTMANLTQLVNLDFSSNKFTGSIPLLHMSKKLTRIDLSDNDLRGPIDSIHWEVLQNLKSINLQQNSLNGSIPSYPFGLPSLQEIQLSNNQFDQLVEFPNQTSPSLESLDLSSNKLQGPIPMCVFELKRLFQLSLSFNNLSGTIQLDIIPRNENLRYLDLSYNSLSIKACGSNSTSFPFPNIWSLQLASCNLTIFPDLKNYSTLLLLDLSNNQIAGIIPNWIWEIGGGELQILNLSHNLLVDLQEPYCISYVSILDLHNNRLSGQFPTLPLFGDYVDYSNNLFDSSIPADLGNNITTSSLSFSSNNLIGIIPESICNVFGLEILDLSNNALSGRIPSCLIERSQTLGVLNLGKNKLHGTIPEKFQGNCTLETLDLNRNFLGGQVPKSLANCTALEVLNLGHNEINDAFPCWLKNVSSLRALILRSNKFFGSISCRGSSSSWPNLQIIDLASNNLSGVLPQESLISWKAMTGDKDENQPKLDFLRFVYTQLDALYYQDSVTVVIKGLEIKLIKILTIFTSIDFSNNRFTGAIPESIGDLTSLHVLNLSHNALTGQIPNSVGHLKQLESLDLSQNKLNGTIPTQLAGLTFLSVLNLSYNQLEGMIPSGTQLQTFSDTSFLGNKGLCGLPLKANCTRATGLSTPTFEDGSPEFGTDINWDYIAAEVGYVVGLGIIIGPLIFWRRWYFKRVDQALLGILNWRGRGRENHGRRVNRNQIRKKRLQ